MALIRSTGHDWPSTSLADFFDLDRLFGGQTRYPAVNVREDARCFFLDVIIPGYSKEQVRVTLEDEMLMISGEHKKEEQKKTERYTRQEYSFSSFSRSFAIPKAVMTDKIDAHYDQGVLTLMLPKKEESAPAKKQVRIL